MKSLRKIIFWSHLTAGVIAGIVILIMSVTGVLLAYEKQIMAWADMRNYRAMPPSAGAGRMPVDALLAKVKEAYPDAAPSTLIMRSEPDLPATVSLTGGRSLFVNPYTGSIWGEGATSVRSFFRTMTDWHRWLGANGESRATARAITGASNLIFLFIVASGFYLWWPRNWTKAQFRAVMWFKRGLGSKARDFNWHNVIGFWSVAPLFIIVLSGVVISYPWAGNLVYTVMGETPPRPAGQSGGGPGTGREAAPAAERPAPAADSLAPLDTLWSRAESHVPGWQIISLRFPVPQEGPVSFTIDEGNGGQPQKRGTLSLDRKTADVTRWEPFSTQTPGRRMRSILRFAHTGEVLGVFGQTVAGLVSAGGVVLVVTGMALTWRRFRGRKKQRANVAALPYAPLGMVPPAGLTANDAAREVEANARAGSGGGGPLRDA